MEINEILSDKTLKPKQKIENLSNKTKLNHWTHPKDYKGEKVIQLKQKNYKLKEETKSTNKQKEKRKKA